MAHVPAVVVWAWERPEDLEFLDPEATGVAFLAGTIRLAGERVETRRRLQRLRVSDGSVVFPVVRIESEPGDPPVLSESQREEAVQGILDLAWHQEPSGVQIDFDALASEREFYRQLLEELRARLPDRAFLSMTALASWCFADRWLRELPVDEAVPMLFRMGADAHPIRAHLDAGRDFTEFSCRASAGVSTDEPLPRLAAGKRLHWFHPSAWSRAAFEAVRPAPQESS